MPGPHHHHHGGGGGWGGWGGGWGWGGPAVYAYPVPVVGDADWEEYQRYLAEKRLKEEKERERGMLTHGLFGLSANEMLSVPVFGPTGEIIGAAPYKPEGGGSGGGGAPPSEWYKDNKNLALIGVGGVVLVLLILALKK